MANKPGTHYSMEQMVQVLKIYELNNFNLNKSSKESGISRAAIKKWADTMGVEVFNKNKLQEIVFKVDGRIATRKEQYDNDVMTAKELMLLQITARIQHTMDMDSLTRGLKVLNELEKDIDQNKKSGTINNTLNFIQLIKDELKLDNHESETI